ncbi:MAG: RSP_7527 family protein [Paracoccaceae bacterium]
MLEPTKRLDHDAIAREARRLQAQALVEMARSVISFFRRKPVGVVAKV